METLASPREHLRNRVLGQPVDLDVWLELAEPIRDGEVALHVAEADGARYEEGALSLATHRPPPGSFLGSCRAEELVQKQVRFDRIAREVGVAATLQLDSLRAGDCSVQRLGDLRGEARLVAAVEDQRRALDSTEYLIRLREGTLLDRLDENLGVSFQAPGDEVLSLFGGVGLRDDSFGPVLEEARVVSP